jgi:hypothetical protein
MIKISHRGNLTGPNPTRENSPQYIREALNCGFHVEIDVWYLNDAFFLGHDLGQYPIEPQFLQNEQLWVHCKNIEALIKVREYTNIHYFWHEEDTLTLTSKGFIWAYPGKQPIPDSIAVMPEIHNDALKACIGICSDFIQKY